MRGTMLTVANLGVQNFIRLASNLILTRLLFPEAFGLMALVQVVLAAAAMFSDIGLHAAVVQSPRGRDPAFLNTTWTVQIIRGMILAAAVVILAAPLARFYDAPELENLLYFAALVPVVQGLNSIRMPLADREIQYGRLVMLHIGSQLVGVCAMTALALVMQSVWALMIGSVAPAVLVAVLSHVVLKGHRDRLALDRQTVVELFLFGRFIFFATVAAFFINYGDRAVLGKFVSLDDLALYNIAFFLASVPILIATELGDKIMFPLYSRKSPSENEEHRRKINLARMGLTSLVLSGLIFMAFVGDGLVRLLYDARYEAAGPILVAIAIAGIPIVLTQSYHKITLAQGNSFRFSIFVVVRALVQMGLLLLTVPVYGVWGAAIAPGLTALVTYPILVWLIFPYKGWDPRHDILFASIAMVATLVLVWFQGATLTAAF
jgi:O-antigen/teichoic acid export membrane protein